MFTFVNDAVNPPSYLKCIFYIIDLKGDFKLGSAVRLVERDVGGGCTAASSLQLIPRRSKEGTASSSQPVMLASYVTSAMNLPEHRVFLEYCTSSASTNCNVG